MAIQVKRITAIEAQKGRKGRVSIFLDGDFALGLDDEVAAKAGLQMGQELSSERIEDLVQADLFHRGYNSALHYLSFRQRTELEIRQRLLRRGFGESTIERVIARLREQGLVDDVAFAQFWRNNRESFKPRSRYLIGQELRRKGVAPEAIEQATAGIDDEASAYQAAQRKARLLRNANYQDFRRRLGGYLRQRGFGYEVIKHAVERLWQERED